MEIVYPQSGANIQELIKVLRAEEVNLVNLPSRAAGRVGGLYDEYRGWAFQAIRMLRPHVRAESNDRLVATRGYWHIQSVDPLHADLRLAQLEIDERRAEFQSAREELEGAVGLWRNSSETLIVADTNVFLHHHEMFTAVAWETVAPQAQYQPCRLIVPLLVIDEIDKAKTNTGFVEPDEKALPPEERQYGTVRSRARRVLRELNELFTDPTKTSVIRGRTAETAAVFATLVMDDPGHKRLPSADNELV